MHEPAFSGLLLVVAAAFAAPFVLGFLPRVRMPAVVLEAIGFGVFIPVFFVTSGLRVDLDALLDDPSNLVMVPVFLVALAVVRGLPALLYRSLVGPRRTLAAARPAQVAMPLRWRCEQAPDPTETQ